MRSLCIAVLVLVPSLAGAGESTSPVLPAGPQEQVEELLQPPYWGDELVHGGWRLQRNASTGSHRLLDDAGDVVARGSWEACDGALQQAVEAGNAAWPSAHLVLLVHGMFGRSHRLLPLQEALHEAGYAAITVDYPSTQVDQDGHADQLGRVLSRLEGIDQISFVTHSMGTLIIRRLLARPGSWREAITPQRLVMLGPPNQGAHLANLFGDTVFFELLTGPAGQQLTAEVAPDLPTPDIPFAIIAGGRRNAAGFNPLLPGDNDGMVRVEETWLSGATDFMVVEANHNQLLSDPDVIAATLRYLQDGTFEQAD